VPLHTIKTQRTEVDVTALLCTYNRAASLAATLESLAASQLPASVGWEVLVIDNNSNDGTGDFVQDFCRRYPRRFRYLFEPKPGKSEALNAGIANALGNILAFVDDDVLVDPRWLQNLTAELHNGEYIGIAGRILPAQSVTLPSWLSWSECGGVLCAHFDLGDHSTELDLKHPPFGANMAFRKNAFEKYGGFRLDLGPRPGSQIRNEDVDFARRLMKAGERLRYEPSAIVYHSVPKGRISKEYFLSWWFDFGRASIRMRDDHPSVCGIPWDYFSLLHRFAQISEMGMRCALGVRASTRFFSKCMAWMQAGMIAELYRRLSDGKFTESAAWQSKGPEPSAGGSGKRAAKAV